MLVHTQSPKHVTFRSELFLNPVIGSCYHLEWPHDSSAALAESDLNCPQVGLEVPAAALEAVGWQLLAEPEQNRSSCHFAGRGIEHREY